MKHTEDTLVHQQHSRTRMGSDPDDNRARVIVIAVSTLVVLASTFALARLHTRLFLTKVFGWDDGLIAFALVWTTTSHICHLSDTMKRFSQ